MRYLYLLLLITIASCAPKAAEQQLAGNAFGTTYNIIYHGTDAQHIQKGIDSVIYRVNRSMSTYMPKSDISKINKGDSTIQVDVMFREVFTLSRKLHKATSGFFDPTVGVLRNAYGFGDTKALKNIDAPTLDSLMQMVGWSKVSLRNNGTIAKSHPNIYFDFNAIAKGYGIDRIGIYLESQNIENYLVELGGELRSKGINVKKQTPWVVGIEAIDSRVTDRAYEAALRLENRAMAASGNYRKNRKDPSTGAEYVHTINPLTGSAAKTDILSATILAATCAEADAWATACMAMGLERSKTVLKNHPEVDAYLTYKGGVFITKGFEEVLKP